MPDERSRRPGRPRKWASEAERKRAYRQRMAEQLADPLAARATARSANDAAATSRRHTAKAEAEARRWQRKADAAERRGQADRARTREATRDARQARQERDRATALLRSKLQWAGKANELRHDPDKLLALIADLNQVCEQYRMRAERAERARFLAYRRTGEWFDLA